MTEQLDIVYLSCCEKWWDWERAGFFSRPAQLARALAGHQRVHRLLVVNTPSSIARGLAGTASGHPRHGLSRISDKVHVLDQVRILPKDRAWRTSYHLNGLLHEFTLAGSIRSAMAELRMERPVLWLSGPLVARTARAFPEMTLVYDAMDEWLALPEMRSLLREIEASYRTISDCADLVFGVSQRLVEHFEGGRPKAYLIPNAVDATRFCAPSEVPADLSDIPSPRAGYIGMLQDRIDVQLTRDVARRLPDVNFVFVGPVLDEDHFAPLRALENVHFLGARPSGAAPNYLAAFDVCILPHRDTELTRNMDPLKLYEYLAAGKLAVASNVSFVQPPELVRRSSDAAEFARHINDALSGAWVPDEGIRAQHLARCTWQGRVDEMLGHIAHARAAKEAALASPPPSPAVVA